MTMRNFFIFLLCLPAFGQLDFTASWDGNDSDEDYQIISETKKLVPFEMDTSGRIALTLNQDPSDSSVNVVLIEVTLSDDTELTLSSDEFYFTSSNWNIPQYLTVTAITDDGQDGNIDVVITFTSMVSPEHDSGGSGDSDLDGGTDSNNPDPIVKTMTVTVYDEFFTEVTNSAPVASDSNVSVQQPNDVQITLVAVDSDDDDVLNYTILSNPTNGQLGTLTNNVITYSPNTDFTGTDSFTFKANDGTDDSNTATVTITVTPEPNTTPIASNASYTVTQPNTLSITLVGTDADSDTLTYTIVGSPSNGSLGSVGSDGSVVYTPTTDFTGSDSFTFKVNDGTIDSNTATISIIVEPEPNTTPVASNASYTVTQPNTLSITLVGTDADSDTLTYTIVDSPSSGSLGSVGSDGSVVYTPTTDFTGSDSFTFKVNDGTIDSNTATISITVNPEPNTTPVASNASYTVTQPNTLSITLVGTDADSDTLTYTIVGSPSNGSLGSVGSGGSVVYTPTTDFTGSDSFTFKVNDGTIDSNTATVSITVNPEPNTTPIASNASYTVTQPNTLSITLVGTDADSDTLTYTIVGSPSNGSLGSVGSGGSVVYTPTTDFTGSDSFTFKVNDGTIDSNTATVSITVNPEPNTTPIASNASYTVTQPNTLSITLVGTDADSDTLTYTIVGTPSNGSLGSVGSDGSVVYTPTTDFTGSDSFTFKVNDGTIDSNTATISITVERKPNVQPFANALSYTVTQPNTLSITLVGTDADSDTLTYTIVDSPSNGSLGSVESDGSVVYTPTTDFTGSDSFTYKVNDGTIDSNTATVSITVNPEPNTTPVASNASYTVTQPNTLSITLVGTDADSDTLTYTIVGSPSNGSLGSVGSGGSVVYTPTTDFTGSDSFTFKVNDGTIDSNTATISITVNPEPNTTPVASNASYTVTQPNTLSITLVGTDADSDTLTYTIVGSPSNGSLGSVGSGGSVVYTPTTDFTGSDSFTFKVNDGTIDSNTATVSITVNPEPNTTPIASNASYTVTQPNTLSITLVGTDADSDTLTYTIVGTPSNGSLGSVGSDGSVVYTPTTDFTGSDSFTFKVNDGTIDSNTATISITVEPKPNVQPFANALSYTVTQPNTLSITLVGTDADSDTLTYTIVDSPSSGSLGSVGSDGSVVYTPTTDFTGSDSFTYKVNDGTIDSNTATVSITVEPEPNTTPVASNASYTVTQPNTLSITLVGTDADSDTLTYTIVGSPSNGSLGSVGSGGSVVYTPTTDFTGSDSFTFKVNDGTIDSNTATVSITVNPEPNTTPIASNASYTVTQPNTLSITLVGTDADSDTLTYTIVGSPSNGSLGSVGSGGSVVYTPTTDFTGSDSFTFKVNDGTIDSNTATVSITVNPEPNTTPIASNASYTVTQPNTLSITLVGTDADSDTLTYTIVGTPSNGSLGSVGSDGSVVYTPTTDFTGSDSFTFKVNDGTIDSNTATISITVERKPNVQPFANALSYTVTQPNTLSITLVGTDADSDTLTYTIVDSPSNGSLGSVESDGSVVYTPTTDFTGSDSFTYKVNDGTIDSNTATVSITVNPEPNTTPVASNASYTVTQPNTLSITLVGTDADSDTLTYTIVGSPSNGSLGSVGSGGSVVYTPTTDFTGSDSFTFKVNDGTIDSNTATISITVNPEPNTTPVASNASYTVTQPNTLSITLVGTDADSDTLTYTIVGSPSNGSLGSVGSGGSVVYTPTTDFTGSDSFTFKVNDGTIDSNTATVSITVNPEPNTTPIASNASYTVTQPNTLSITLVGTDADSDTLTYTIVGTPIQWIPR